MSKRKMLENKGNKSLPKIKDSNPYKIKARVDLIFTPNERKLVKKYSGLMERVFYKQDIKQANKLKELRRHHKHLSDF
jgi:hypothetical protein